MALTAPSISEPDDHLWLSDAAALDSWLAELVPGTPVAIDSEFERTSTFFAIPGLVQVATATDARLIEPDAVTNSIAFKDWLGDRNQPKWLYAMSEDIELFREWLGCPVEGVVDIQIAAALAGEGMSVGYARLVEALFGVALGKEETRSNWLQRPLSKAQQRYALADVIYLIPMATFLMDRLAELGLDSALVEESDRFSQDLQSQGTPERYYLRLRGGWRLSHGQQEALQALCRWREEEARKQNIPRSRVVADKLLLPIAERMPRNIAELGEVQELPRIIVRKHGQALLECIDQSRQHGQALPEYIEGPLTRAEQTVYTGVKTLVHNCCKTAAVPPELFAPRKKLEAAVREGVERQDVPRLLGEGWRGELMGEYQDDLRTLFTRKEG